MNSSIKLGFLTQLKKSLSVSEPLIQVILGPRQVGKTTGIQIFLKSFKKSAYHYVSADGVLSKTSDWILEQWLMASNKDEGGLLVIDEVQKVENWSETIKKLWDQQARSSQRIKVVLLGSSSLDIQKGLSESLTGRFLLHRVYQWNFNESQKGYKLSFEELLKYGGYPGSYQFKEEIVQWLNYMKNSIVETVVGKDILSLARVKSPALFHQSFYIAMSYGGQEISYTKLLGQLQDKGNVEIIKHYLELFEGAFLLRQLFKYSNKAVLSRSSSPKILPMAPALYSMNKDVDLSQEEMGRAFEIVVGCELVRLPGQLYYWRQGKYEVDFVYKFGKKLTAIEVKYGKNISAKGLEKFKEEFPSTKLLLLTPENYKKQIESLKA